MVPGVAGSSPVDRPIFLRLVHRIDRRSHPWPLSGPIPISTSTSASFRHRRQDRPARDHRAPFDPSRPRRGRHPFWHYAERRRAARRAAPVARDELQERDGRAADGRRQGGHPADADRTKTPEMLAAFGRAVERLGGRYVTAEDVGMSGRRHGRDRASRPARRRPAGRGRRGRRRSRPAHQLGVYLGIKAAVSARSARTASPGCTSPCRARAASPAASRAAPRPEGARLTIADVDAGRAQGARRRGRRHGRRARRDHGARGRRAQPQRARRDPRRGDASPRSTRRSSPAAPTTSSPRPRTASASTQRGILYAPDYVINAGGIINVSHRISGRRRRTAWCASGSRRSPAGSSRSGAKAPRPAATRPRSPTPWRRR